MNTTKYYLVAFWVFIFLLPLFGLSQNVIFPNAYAHNDYWHKRPLHDALENGFTYVEADIYLRNNELVVAHLLPFLKKKRTLEKLYLEPLLAYIVANDKMEFRINNYPITLMIDIKSEGDKTFVALEKLLSKYQSILSYYNNGTFVGRYVTVVVTGHKPYALIKEKNNRFVFIDEDLKKSGVDTSSNVYPIASCRYSAILSWTGKGTMPAGDKERLNKYVKQAHDNGRKVRLYAAPENVNVWKELLKCKVDLINTDNILALRKFLLSDLSLYTRVQ